MRRTSSLNKNSNLTAQNIYGLLHDIASPLTLIQLNLEIVYSKMSIEQKKSYADFLEGALQGITQANKIILSCKHAKKEKRCFVVNEIEELLSIFSGVLTKNKIIINKNYQADLELQTENIYFRRVVINLLKNAIESFTETKQIKKLIQISTSIDEGQFILTISDNGKGINKALLKNIFAIQISSKAKSRGWGLKTSSDIANKKLNANIQILATSTKGTKIALRFNQQIKKGESDIQIVS